MDVSTLKTKIAKLAKTNEEEIELNVVNNNLVSLRWNKAGLNFPYAVVKLKGSKLLIAVYQDENTPAEVKEGVQRVVFVNLSNKSRLEAGMVINDKNLELFCQLDNQLVKDGNSIMGNFYFITDAGKIDKTYKILKCSNMLEGENNTYTLMYPNGDSVVAVVNDAIMLDTYRNTYNRIFIDSKGYTSDDLGYLPEFIEGKRSFIGNLDDANGVYVVEKNNNYAIKDVFGNIVDDTYYDISKDLYKFYFEKEPNEEMSKLVQTYYLKDNLSLEDIDTAKFENDAFYNVVVALLAFKKRIEVIAKYKDAEIDGYLSEEIVNGIMQDIENLKQQILEQRHLHKHKTPKQQKAEIEMIQDAQKIYDELLINKRKSLADIVIYIYTTIRGLIF